MSRKPCQYGIRRSPPRAHGIRAVVLSIACEEVGCGWSGVCEDAVQEGEWGGANGWRTAMRVAGSRSNTKCPLSSKPLSLRVPQSYGDGGDMMRSG